MIGEIIKSEVMLIGISLPGPFHLAFGTLTTLPRVFLVITFLGEKQELKGIGEASIDFPFSHYDAWDIYDSLSKIDLIGLNVMYRKEILDDPKCRSLLNYPAAFAALNMALDDSFGRLNRVSIPSLYGQVRLTGQALESIAIPENESLLRKDIERVLSKGNIPKLKCGQGASTDIELITSAVKLSNEHDSKFAIDFNAFYTANSFQELISAMRKLDTTSEMIIFLEQPVDNLNSLLTVDRQLKQYGVNIPVMADESFVTMEDALFCHKNNILLNYKIQKLGGIMAACEIQGVLTGEVKDSMVGGTFPTAIGRVWDQQGLCVLKSANLPSDGWQPATDWFKGERHLISEQFKRNTAFLGDGLGVTIAWDKFEKYRVTDPKYEYQSIRNDKSGRELEIVLNPGIKYSDLYQELSGKPHDWNI